MERVTVQGGRPGKSEGFPLQEKGRSWGGTESGREEVCSFFVDGPVVLRLIGDVIETKVFSGRAVNTSLHELSISSNLDVQRPTQIDSANACHEVMIKQRPL